MKKLLLATAAAIVIAAPAFAQGIEVGPGGISVGRDHEHYDRDRDHRSGWERHDRDRDRDHDRHHPHHRDYDEDYE